MSTMKIAYIATGAAGMICGTCIHDNTLASALMRGGHEVALIPTYTPIRTDEEDVSLDRIFFGGLSVYLEERFSFFRQSHPLLDKLLASRGLLNWLSRFSSSTNARDLGKLTVSVLKGEAGHQRKELAALIDWLVSDYKPDIVHLNHSMLVGFAREIKRRLAVPVVCGVQGEDLFLDDLTEPYKSEAHRLLHERARDVDAVLATSDYYADFMSTYLGLSRDVIHVVRLGIKLDGHGVKQSKGEDGSLTIGYLARLCPEKGLHLLIEAFHQLWKKYESGHIKLRIAGYLDRKDESYFDKLRDRIRELGLEDAVDYAGEVDRKGKIAFLQSLDIFSVPTVYKESKGLSILEALANGVPVVQPAHGLFPELVEKTGGGLLVRPDSPDALAEGLATLVSDAALRRKLGDAGCHAVHQTFSDDKMAEATLAVYRSCMKERESLAQ